MNIHDESKAFKCNICSKVFKSKAYLKAHYRTHTGEKPFTCLICDKRFSKKQSLVQHQATHKNDMAVKCSICPEGRYFKTKFSLNQHMVFHYELKFSFNYCNHKC